MRSYAIVITYKDCCCTLCVTRATIQTLLRHNDKNSDYCVAVIRDVEKRENEAYFVLTKVTSGLHIYTHDIYLITLN